MKKPIPRLTRLAASLACGVVLSAALPALLPIVGTSGIARAQGAGQLDQFRQVLQRYGSFQSHARYGEVWIPAEQVAPRGWHPYPPCNWVHHKELGWVYDDRSEWGSIVHHHGRWAHDVSLGWVWVPGTEYSPGWVVWRTSDTWVGWAPMPPEQDVKEISADAFNSDKHWIFMDAKTFGARCKDASPVVQGASYPAIFQATRLVTEVRFVRGIAVFVLPPPLIINVVDIDIGIFAPWSPCFFGAWFWNWNVLVNNVVINVILPAAPGPGGALCMKQILPIKSDPPPAPPGGKQPQLVDPPRLLTPPLVPPRQPGRQTELPPVFQPPVFQPPGGRPPVVTLPPPTIGPRHPVPPVRVVDPVPPRQPGGNGPGVHIPPRGGNGLGPMVKGRSPSDTRILVRRPTASGRLANQGPGGRPLGSGVVR